jgi:hypothetical protein
MKCLAVAAMMVGIAGFAGLVGADEQLSPVGTWKWSVNPKLEMTLRLKLEGKKLSGVLIANNGRETPVEDGKYEDGKISFKVVSELAPKMDKVTVRYAGKLSGDTIKGEMKVSIGSRPSVGSIPWKATRVKEEEPGKKE